MVVKVGGRGSLYGALFLAAMTAAWIFSPLLAPKLLLPLDVSTIKAESGYAYIVPVTLPISLLFVFRSDSGGDPAASELVVREDGRLLGPAHTSHDEIRANGRGRFSHWGAVLYFSASDNSDPRSNGRRYAAAATATLAPWAKILIFTLDAVFVVAMRARLLAILRSRPEMAARIFATAAIVMALLMAGGFLSVPVSQTADLQLTIAIAGHVLLALVLTLAQWAVGAGIARAILSKREASYAHVLLLGFPASLVACALLVAVALLVPLGGVLALGLAMICILPLALWPLEAAPLRNLLRRLPLLILLSAAFATWLALQWHGPSATLSASPTGDLTFYASMMWAIAVRPPTWVNLANEGESHTYFNMLIPALGAAVRSGFEIDGFLFILTMTGVTSLLGTAFALHAYVASRPTFALWSLEGLALGLSVLAAGRYPYWVAESPPAAYVVPLTIAVWFWVAESRRAGASPALGLTLAFVGSMTTKVVSFVTLGSLAIAAFGRSAPKFSRQTLIVAGLLISAIAVYVTTMTIEFLPFYLQVAAATPESYVFLVETSLTRAWPYLARDIGCVLLGVAAFRLLAWPVSAAVAIGFAAAIAFPFLLRVNSMCAVVVLGLAAVDEPARLRNSKVITLAGLLLCIPAMVLTDPGGEAAGIGWLTIASTLLVVTLRRRAQASAVAQRILPLLVTTALVVVLLAIVALGRGVLPLVRHGQSGTLTPQLREIWRAVRDVVPADALVFTDQTGVRPSLTEGWNTFALHGQRQIFHANWYQSLSLRNNPQLRDARLAENDDVLSGRRAPNAVATSRHYSDYYAVVQTSRRMDPPWQCIYGNEVYRLCRWRP